MLELDPIWFPEIQQHHFRQMLDSMARPGKCLPIDNVPKQGPTVLSVLATLLDNEVSLADPHNLLRSDDWPKLQANPAAPDQADYIICDGKIAPDFVPKLGTLHSPELSATIILMVEQLGVGDTYLSLRGPGIEHSHTLVLGGLHLQWLSMREDWISDFPLGVDFYLVDKAHMTALPRTSKVEIN